MDENIRNWLEDLYKEARKNAIAAAQNERIWANGAPDAVVAQMHLDNAENQERYAEALQALIDNLNEKEG